MQYALTRLFLATLFLPALAACAGSPDRIDDESAAPRLAASETAVSMLGKPYRYGGYSPSGFDCSGLVFYSFRRAGVELPRDTRSMRSAGREISRSALSRGDLVFFDQEGKKSSHVGIYLGNGKFVHAPSSGGHVRIDRLDEPYWERHFNEARRI